jgi:ABC-type antimicrobial peptide transport system permease subunit
MPLFYPIKHVFRNWKLFTALLIGVSLAATFCAAIGVKSNLAAEQALDKQLSNVITDIGFNVPLNQSNLALAYDNITSIEDVKRVDYVASFSMPISISSENYSTSYYTQMASFPNTSQIYDEWKNKPYFGIPENYTYILAGSQLAQRVKIGDNITTMIQFPTPKYYNTSSIYVNLTVAGFATLTDTGYSLLTGNTAAVYFGGGAPPPLIGYSTSQVYGSPYSSYRQDMMIVSWENTLQNLWNTTLDSSTSQITFSVTLNRQNLISPWNIGASIDKVNAIADNIQNQILANYLAHGYVNNMLGNSLSSFQSGFQSMVINFFIVSIPVFFVAWYLGSTVSDVSFNIRRREIGLLSTKGLSSGQIQRMFLTEALVIGLIGGALGIVGGLILNQYYAGTINLNNLFASRMFSPEIAAITIVFGIALALTSVFWSSRKASKLPAVDALRDYMPIDSIKTRQKILPVFALILGSYKITMYLFGVNMQRLITQSMFSGGNFFLSMISGPLILFDLAMTYFGPFLFFWGLTKLVIRDSTKFQMVAAKISSVMGDLGALAAKNVRRNPARLAAIAFLIAFIIGFSVQVTGQVASQQDFTFRQVQAQVGADVTVSVVNASKVQFIYDEIIANVTGIRNATVERTLYAPLSEGNTYNRMQLRTIEPETFTSAAYYEPWWFNGASIDTMMKDLKGSNNTIIIDRTLAKQLNLKLYDEVGIDFNSCPRKLRIIGFFGPEPIDNSGGIIIDERTSRYNLISAYSQFYSYVPRDLFNMSAYSGIYTVEDFTQRILIKLSPGANGSEVANQIRSLDPTEIYGVDSFDEEWQQSQSMNNIYTYSNLQVLDVQGLGLVFAVLSASVGTALIAIVSLKERSREATLMSVRGLSYRQLVWMFLTESMAIITFSVILGVFVGVIIVYGTVTSANNSLYIAQLVTQRLIYPPNALVTIGTYVALIYASTIGVILLMTSQYVTKLERMVRSR